MNTSGPNLRTWTLHFQGVKTIDPAKADRSSGWIATVVVVVSGLPGFWSVFGFVRHVWSVLDPDGVW